MANIANNWLLVLGFQFLAIYSSVGEAQTEEDFLRKYGYLNTGSRAPSEFTEAVRKFQAFYGLPVSGIVDAETRRNMALERCQLEDYPTSSSPFTINGAKWITDLKWRLNIIHPSVSAADADRVMAESVAEWDKYMSTITITKSTDTNSHLIVDYPVSDANGDHGDGNSFAPQTLAHAFYPSTNPLGGDIHYNTIHPFSAVEPPASTDFSLKAVTVHELGHSLGIAHSMVQGAIMFPTFSRGASYPGLHADDIMAIQFLYGPCSDNPCLNGGTCTIGSTPKTFTCGCPSTHTGATCGTPVATTCAGNPCLNGGACVDTASGRTCNCPSTHIGINCETRNFCSTNPCQNGGTCVNGASTYSCVCPSTHEGMNCQTQKTANPCAANPGLCLNGGTCHQASNSAGYSCVCPITHSGNQCQVSKCAATPCLNGGTCTLNIRSVTGYTCTCPSTHMGTMCQVSVCATNPCENGGQCILDPSESTGLTCQCADDYTGNRCQSRKQTVTNGVQLTARASWWLTGTTIISLFLLF